MTEQHKATETAKQAPPPQPPPVDEREEERKKAREKSEKDGDELIKKYKEEIAGADPDSEVSKKLAADQEKARLLNIIYNEKYAPGVRKTPAQENAEKDAKRNPPGMSQGPELAGQH